MTPSGFDVFDCHHHVGDVSAFLGAAELVVREATEVDTRIAIMDAGGVGQAAVFPSHAYERVGADNSSGTVTCAFT